MASLPKPEVILTHESDLDGLVSGLLLQRVGKKLFGEEIPLEAYHYNTWRQREPRENAAWVADMAFEPRLDRPNWVVFDHHSTDTSPKHAQLIHDSSKSAGLICYDLCKQHGLDSPALDRLIHLNNVADLFLDTHEDFVIANDYAALVKVYQFWNVHALINGELEKLLDHPLLEVMAVKRRIEDPLGLEWSKANVQEISPTIGFVDTVVGNNNLIVHKLLEGGHTPYTALVTFFRRANGPVTVSLRSRNGEALKIAERLQGGGHPNAAGATLPKSVRSINEAIDYLRRILSPGPPPPEKTINSLEAAFAALNKS